MSCNYFEYEKRKKEFLDKSKKVWVDNNKKITVVLFEEDDNYYQPTEDLYITDECFERSLVVKSQMREEKINEILK